MKLRSYLGDRAFYRRVLAVALPIMIQNGITTFVSLLDNIMVGQVGTIQMSGVSIANQLLFVFNLCIFGASSGAGIFTAQFHGSGDADGIRHTMRFKLLSCLLLTGAGLALFLTADETLIGLYLQGEGDPLEAAGALRYGKEYLQIMLLGLVPFAVANAYSSTLRETGQTVVPMVAGIVAVLVNLALNYILIFGHLGVQPMGVQGAAIATVVSRYVEMGIVMVCTHLNPAKNPYIRGLFRSVYIPGSLCRRIFLKGMPLLMNEFLWSSGMAVMNQCYSTCDLDVVPAMNIASTIGNLGNVAFLAMGNAVGILMGQMLGAGHTEAQVRDTNRKLVAVSVVSGVLFGGIIMALSDLFPHLYNTTEEVRALSSRLIWVWAVMTPFYAFTNASYFTLRSGGQTMVTFLFDSCFVWALCVPLAFCLSRFTDLPILPLYVICQSTEFLKCALGSLMVRKGKWIQNLAA